jgi:hypothetical protein
MKTEMYRQGDVLFRRIAALPEGSRKVRKNGHILEGEKTGHIHRVRELDRADVLEINEGLYLNVTEAGVSIVHEDHKTLELPPGDFEIVRQREYSPEEIRNVAD